MLLLTWTLPHQVIAGIIYFLQKPYSTASRYRSIAAVTLEMSRDQEISHSIQELLKESNVKEFKWEKLRQARERFAGLKMIECQPDTPRQTATPKKDLTEIRREMDTHIKNMYLKKVQAPIGVKSTLLAWMELV